MLHMGYVYKKCSPGGQWMLYFQILLVSAYGFSMESTKNHYRFLFFLTPTSILSTIPIGAASKMRTGSGRFLPLPPTPRSPSPCPGGRFQRTLSSQCPPRGAGVSSAGPVTWGLVFSILWFLFLMPGLWTCCDRCWNDFPSDMLRPHLLPHSGLCSNITSLERLTCLSCLR